MTALPNLRLNPDPQLRRQAIGDNQFCVIVDDFLANPEALIEIACASARQFYAPTAGYPGLMLYLDPELVADFNRFIRTRMSPLFGFLRGDAQLKTGLSMTTLPPAKLANFQRLCHTDPRGAPGRRSYAALVYLFENENLGGTAFYRWKQPDIVNWALALELQDPSAAARFLAEHTQTFRQSPQYMTAANELAEQVAVLPARFNRLLFYSGEVPHSGHITDPGLLSTDFRQGRLTLNCFASVLPR